MAMHRAHFLLLAQACSFLPRLHDQAGSTSWLLC